MPTDADQTQAIATSKAAAGSEAIAAGEVMAGSEAVAGKGAVGEGEAALPAEPGSVWVGAGSAVAERPLLAGTPVPVDVFEPIEVARQLESAGIIVSLPDLPVATTPAAILFADTTGGGSDFTWLHGRGAATATTTAPAARPAAGVTESAITTGPAGLPKRIPRGRPAGAASGQETPAANRDAARARGFMSGLQEGIRHGENREGESGS